MDGAMDSKGLLVTTHSAGRRVRMLHGSGLEFRWGGVGQGRSSNRGQVFKAYPFHPACGERGAGISKHAVMVVVVWREHE